MIERSLVAEAAVTSEATAVSTSAIDVEATSASTITATAEAVEEAGCCSTTDLARGFDSVSADHDSMRAPATSLVCDPDEERHAQGDEHQDCDYDRYDLERRPLVAHLDDGALVDDGCGRQVRTGRSRGLRAVRLEAGTGSLLDRVDAAEQRFAVLTSLEAREHPAGELRDGVIVERATFGLRRQDAKSPRRYHDEDHSTRVAREVALPVREEAAAVVRESFAAELARRHRDDLDEDPCLVAKPYELVTEPPLHLSGEQMCAVRDSALVTGIGESRENQTETGRYKQFPTHRHQLCKEPCQEPHAALDPAQRDSSLCHGKRLLYREY